MNALKHLLLSATLYISINCFRQKAILNRATSGDRNRRKRRRRQKEKQGLKECESLVPAEKEQAQTNAPQTEQR